MAETIVSAVVGDVVSRVISLLIGLLRHQQTTKAKLQRICHMLIRIHSVVEEAKGRRISNHGTLQWLSELIDCEYQGRYLLDTIRCGEHELEDEQAGDNTELPQFSTLSLFNPTKRLRVAACTMRSVLSRCRDGDVDGADGIDRVTERLQGVVNDLKEFIMLLQLCRPIFRPLSTSIFRDGQMFSRHVEKERIINFLLHDGGLSSSMVEVGVLPIVGGMGSGKTTLMQHACDNARVRNHFPVIMMCYTITARTNGGAVVFRSKLALGDAGISVNDPLQLLNGRFGNKRFLIVFEDVDMRKKHLLEQLLPSLRQGKKGSKVIITTNNHRIATIGTVEPIILKPLPFPEYWFFFKAHAFAGRDAEEKPRLVAVGRAIARKLNGSFFGAKIIGELLRDHSDPKFWCTVLRSNIGVLSPLGDGIAYISDLVDNLLPGHMDLCMVTVSKGPFPSPITGLSRLQDLCSAAPHGSGTTCWADAVRFEKVLLCKSVLPFNNCYYIARCTCTCAMGSPMQGSL